MPSFVRFRPLPGGVASNHPKKRKDRKQPVPGTPGTDDCSRTTFASATGGEGSKLCVAGSRRVCQRFCFTGRSSVHCPLIVGSTNEKMCRTSVPDEIFFPSFGLLAFHWFDYTKFKTCTQVSIWTQNVIPGGQKGPFLPELWKASNFNPKKSAFLPVSFLDFCRFCLIFSVHFRHAEVVLFTKPLRHPFGMPPPLQRGGKAYRNASPPCQRLPFVGELASEARLRGLALHPLVTPSIPCALGA